MVQLLPSNETRKTIRSWRKQYFKEVFKYLHEFDFVSERVKVRRQGGVS